MLLWIANSNTEMYSSNAIMQLWLKSTKDYSVEQVNYIPTSVSGMGIVATLLLGWYSDYDTSRRWHVGILLSLTAITSGALMLSPPTRAAKFAALIINGCQFAGQTVMFAWANDLTRRDDAKRSVIIASMNMFSIAIYMWWSIVFYNATQAPDWFEGNIAMICMGAFLMVTTLATLMFAKTAGEDGEGGDRASWGRRACREAKFGGKRGRGDWIDSVIRMLLKSDYTCTANVESFLA